MYDLLGYDANVFHQEETAFHRCRLDLFLHLSIVNTSNMSLNASRISRKLIGTKPKHQTVSLFQICTLGLDKGGYSGTSFAYVSISLQGVTYNKTVILIQ